MFCYRWYAFFIFRVRDLTTGRIGTLTRITGQVVRTHPVHPELVSGVFICLECRTVIKDVEQQFKYTQVCVCYNNKKMLVLSQFCLGSLC